MSHDFTYCGHCYSADADKPFGFCDDCWEGHGKPMAVEA